MPCGFLNEYKNKKIGFVGLGISNLPIAQLMRQSGIDVTLRDKKQPEGDFDGFRCFFGDEYLDGIDEDLLFLAPVIRPDMPQLAGVATTTEMQEFFKHCKAKIIAVTGSDGKTTTTTLIARLIESGGKRVFLGGNLGKNLFCALPEISADDVVVCELSSFQLMKMRLSPYGAVVTNLSPNHLDWHIDFDEYACAKLNILKYQPSDGFCVLNADDLHHQAFAQEAQGRVLFTSSQNPPNYYNSNGVFYDNTLVIGADEILLPGMHNRANICQAVTAAAQIVDTAGFRAVIAAFGGVEHRCQFIREVGGVRFYNSSIDSSPTRTAAALSSFDNRVVLIAGGYDKKIPLEPLGGLLCDKTKAVILMGDTGVIIKQILQNHGYEGEVFSTDCMKQAVERAYNIAKQGDTVILSPAAASFGLYKNFEERGRVFTEAVNDLNER